MGFCLLNHAMIGVARAQAVHGLGKVAVLDFDVHMGNGCAAACWADPTRLYASSHQAGIFPVGFSRYAPDGSGVLANIALFSRAHSLPEAVPPNSICVRVAIAARCAGVAPEHLPQRRFRCARPEDVASLALEDDDYYWITGDSSFALEPEQLFPHPRLVDARWSLGHDSQESFFDFLCSCSSSHTLTSISPSFQCSPSAPFRASSVTEVAHHPVLEGGYKLDVLSRGGVHMSRPRGAQ